ncbi:MAG: YbgC/FadM family acyl-CoA thioesterase [Lautropia sp.]
MRVYYEDTDAGGIVYYANYLRFFERARSDWLRALGVDQRKLSENDALGFVVRDCTIRFVAPARLDDELDIHVAIGSIDADLRRASMRVSQRAMLAERVSNHSAGNVRVACISTASGKPAPIPDWILHRMIRASPSPAAGTRHGAHATPSRPLPDAIDTP